MPARRRQGKRRRSVDPWMFVTGDGVTPFFPGLDDVFENRFLARAAWQTVRAAAWADDTRGMWPPRAATVYDKITQYSFRRYPAEVWIAAAEVDIASVERWRREEPAKAATITEHLDQCVEDLTILIAVAEQVTSGRTDEHSFRKALTDLEMRRQYS